MARQKRQRPDMCTVYGGPPRGQQKTKARHHEPPPEDSDNSEADHPKASGATGTSWAGSRPSRILLKRNEKGVTSGPNTHVFVVGPEAAFVGCLHVFSNSKALGAFTTIGIEAGWQGEQQQCSVVLVNVIFLVRPAAYCRGRLPACSTGCLFGPEGSSRGDVGRTT